MEVTDSCLISRHYLHSADSPVYLDHSAGVLGVYGVDQGEFGILPQSVGASGGILFPELYRCVGKCEYGLLYAQFCIVTVVAIFLLVIIALPASYVLARFKFKSSKFWNVLFMAGLFINVNYIVVPIFLMLNDGDKWIYKTFGTTFFMNNLFVLALVYAATALPFTIYLLSGYFKTLARDYEEAAYVDDAGYFRTMVQIIIPMAKPSIVTVILFNFLAFWNEYIISMTLLTKPELKTLPVGLMNLMAAQRSAVQYGKMYAGLVIVMLPTLILYMCVQKKLTQGMTVGGLKG